MTWDSKWESVFQNTEWGKYPGEDLIRFVAANYYSSERSKVKILEIGCGPGANVWFLAREGFDVHGMDGSATAVQLCKQRLSSEGLKATVNIGDVKRLSYPDDHFDAVIDIECLCCNTHKSTETIIKEVFRVLKPGGKFYSRTFADEMYVRDKDNRNSKLEFDEALDGPLAYKGFVRLSDTKSIKELYGTTFLIENIDKSSYTLNNSAILVSEWQIVCRKSVSE